VAAVFFSPDERKAVLVETDSNGWALKLLELEKNVKSHLLEDKDTAIAGILLSNLKFSPDSRRILLKVGSAREMKNFTIDLEKSPPDLESLDFLGKNIEDISFHPEDSQKLFLLKNGDIFEADLIQKKASRAVPKNVKAFLISDKDAYYLENSGFLFKTGLSFSDRIKINQNSFPLDKKKEYKIYVFSDKIFLQGGRNLYLFNSNSGSFENFFETARKPEVSPDSKKLLYFSDYEIWVLYLKDEFSQPQKSAGDRQFIARFSEKIGNVFWLTSHYLIFSTGDKIKIAEIDDRDKINIVDWSPPADNIEGLEIFFNQNDKKLYILSGGNLHSSERLLP
jgi:hypothetical protein